MLDTSILIDLQRDEKKTIELLDRYLTREQPARISFMTYVEFWQGTEGYTLEKKTEIKKFIWQFVILHTTNATALILAKLKHDYDKKKLTKSMNDLFIAAQAIEHNLTLITKDRDFEDVTELKKVIL